ncbi:Ras-associating (RA) domain, partial [Trinorchestia longiramus]
MVTINSVNVGFSLPHPHGKKVSVLSPHTPPVPRHSAPLMRHTTRLMCPRTCGTSSMRDARALEILFMLKLEFHGVMRFYFQDSGQKVATKCIRVTSLATTRQVISTLVEKFRPDMRMLSAPSYLLYEIHENGEERRLADDEKPLLVQLNWNRDDREGRFLLRRVDLTGKVHLPPLNNSSSSLPKDSNGSNFIRKLSRREKKEAKKQEKQRRAQEAAAENSVAEKLYTDVPYKTLLLSVRDSAQSVVKEMLEKYGLYRENPANYCLVQ